ncbi:hypothetical protein [Nonomuraea recticatena]|uniref:Uncharacterized protein n=1 Tax=Nonomuraea recticatena TaxID=46178 RepID=A0ABN3S9V5_9ACTN
MAVHGLQQQFGQVDAREHVGDPLAQVHQRGGFGQRRQRRHVQPTLLIHRDPDAFFAEPRGDISQRLVQDEGVLGQELAGDFGQGQVGERRPLGRLPPVAVQELAARVLPAG